MDDSAKEVERIADTEGGATVAGATAAHDGSADLMRQAAAALGLDMADPRVAQGLEALRTVRDYCARVANALTRLTDDDDALRVPLTPINSLDRASR